MKKNSKKVQTKRAMPVWGWVALAVGLVILIGAGIALMRPAPTADAPLPAEINVAQAAQKRDEGAFILDVREPSEWVSFHIPGATLIPLGELPARLSEVPKDREIVVVCRSGNRSQTGRDILIEAGFAKATSMAGGVNDWQAQGLPIVSGE